MIDKKGGPFAPIENKIALRVAADNADGWTLLAPVPSDAPTPPKRHPKLGAPSRIWTYRDEAGELLGYIHRFDPSEGKQFRPLALWRSEGAALEWRWQSWNAPRPLYGLDRLAARPSALVLVCEGEKSADAAERILPDVVAVTSPNGAKSAKKADWTALKGRAVVIWPDADDAGLKFAEIVVGELAGVGAASIAIITPPVGVAPGWDAADAEQEGWTPARAAALIAGATPIAAEAKSPKTKPEKTRRPPARDTIIALTEDCSFWHSPEQVAFVTFPVNSHCENWRVRSDAFKRWLTGRAYRHNGAVPGAQAVEDVIRFLEGKSINDGPERAPFRRTGERDGKIYVDLGDASWRVIEIYAGGWRLLENHDLPNIRSAAMQALPEPIVADNGAELFPFVNVASEDEYKLVVAWLVAALRPRGPYPILLIQGEQGSGKSILSRLLRSIIDPNTAPIRAAPKDEEDLIVAAKNGHVIALDNVSKIDPIMADALCRVATGGGFSTRVKYTNDEEHVVWTCNPVLANGIPSLGDRPDLASRAIIVRLVSIPEEKRRAEDEHWSDWGRAAPAVLGTLCDALARALVNLPNVRLARPSRMADFEKLIEAASPALAWPPGAFAHAYAINRRDTESAAFEADPLAMAIEKYFKEVLNGEPVALTATELLSRLTSAEAGGALLVPEGLRRSRSWPQTAQGLGNRIDRITPILRARGTIIERKHSGDRKITIAKAEPR
jgi:hypothetical protein